jgi:antitoxin component of MazEF toxin-antitoxin module
MCAVVKFERKIRQSGGSAAVTIPDELLKAVGLQKGDKVTLCLNDNHQIIIEKAV